MTGAIWKRRQQPALRMERKNAIVNETVAKKKKQKLLKQPATTGVLGKEPRRPVQKQEARKEPAAIVVKKKQKLRKPLVMTGVNGKKHR